MEVEEVSDQYSPEDVEEDVKDYWGEEDAYEKAKEAHADDPDYYFLDGPPYTSGQMHLGTAWNKTLKDCVIRYLRMQGYDVVDRPGYDMHGLPIEVKVEEEMGFENKNDIEEFGVENFIDKCKEFAQTNLEKMNEDFQSIGTWMDWDNPYRTMSNEYMEALWWGFKKVFDSGLVEKDKGSINQCPRCETAIADAEVEYHEIESPSIYVKFPLRDEEGYLVIWTTTPWTIPANTFVAVDEDVEYQKVRAEKDGEKEVLYLATECVEEVLKKARYQDYEVLETLEGEELVGLEYEHPLADEVPDHASFDGALEVYHGDYVEVDRTGLVHSAPGHGEEDFERGTELGLDVFCPVATDGKYTDEGGKYAGTFVREANPDIIDDLRENGLLLHEGRHEHRYGQCWRCDTDIIFLATEQWFIRVTENRDKLLEELEKSEWYPQWARDSRQRDWIESARDWNISRQRYWGVPIPIWVCEDGHKTCVGTREELAEKSLDDVNPLSEDFDLHRPGVDPVTLECDECGEPAERVEDVFDVWADSAVASWGALDYPSEEEKFEELWPTDLIIEAHDQTRGWFWSQLGMSVSALDQVPYEKVVMHGHALDEDGRKMSKSLGNIVTPEEAIERYGADPLRTFLLSHTPQGDDMRFSWDEMAEMQRTLNVFWNTFRFPLPYMELDDFDPEETTVESVELTQVDEWILSRLQSVKQEIDEHFDDFETHKAQQALLDFVTEDVSRFYVQVVRPRMWEEEESGDKQAAYATLYRVLRESIIMLAPFAPFVSEAMYQKLDGEKTTVHELYWPETDQELLDKELEENIDVVREVEEAGANARQKAERKLRWPVGTVVVRTDEDGVERAVNELNDLLLDRLNAKSIEVVRGEWDESIWSVEPRMDVLGPEYGQDAGKIKAQLEEMTRSDLEEAGYEIEVDGETIEVTDEMIEYSEELPDNVASAEFSDGTVYVDASLNPELESEGYSREVVRRVQEMRKELELDVEERIRVALEIKDERVADLVNERIDYVAEETRADEILESVDETEDALVEEWDVEDVEIVIGVETV